MYYDGDVESHDPSILAYRMPARQARRRPGSTVSFSEIAELVGAAAPDQPVKISWGELGEMVEPSRRASKPRSERLRDRLKREHTELSSALAVIAAKLARREEQLAKLAKYPEDEPFTDGAILRFEKKFPNSPQRYSYIAMRADGAWYVTGGRSPQGITWEQLVDFMGLGVDEVYHVNALTAGGRQREQKVIG